MNENQNANMSREEYNKLQAKQIRNSLSVFDGKEFLLRLADVELPSGSTTIWDLPEGYIFKDENGNVINATKIVLEKKKPKYPKSYLDCLKVLGIGDYAEVFGYKCELLNRFQTLLICRDAYWKIAGDWKPDYDSGCDKFGIFNFEGVIQKSCTSSSWERHINKILDFPTAEMRDAFYENFKDLIEECKELL